MTHDPVFLAFCLATILFTILLFFIFYFTSKYWTNQIRHNEEKQQLIMEHQKSKLDEAERVLLQVSKYIHDNIGQTAHILRMNLHVVEDFDLKGKEYDIVNNMVTLADRMVSSSRSISHSLNSNFIKQQGLEKAINNELRFINSLGQVNCLLTVVGVPGILNSEEELIIFRIVQETVQNTLKHAKATLLNIRIHYEPILFLINLKDNGVGFNADSESLNEGMGFNNIRRRVKQIEGMLDITSTPGNGCMTTVSVQRNHRDSIQTSYS